MRNSPLGSASKAIKSPKIACSATEAGYFTKWKPSNTPSNRPRLAHAAPDDHDTIVEMTIGLLNQRVFAALIEAEGLKPAEIARFSHTMAELTRLNIARQNHAYDMDSHQTHEERHARVRRAKASRADSFAAVRNALSAVKVFNTQIVPAPVDDPGRSPVELPQGQAAARRPRQARRRWPNSKPRSSGVNL